MKKARIILATIALLAIVSATMAFKMRNGTPRLVVPQFISTYIFTYQGTPYTVTYWYCSTTSVWRTNIGSPIQTWSSFLSTYTTFDINGQPFTTTFVACTTFQTATTALQ
ncbi:hypothetical protein [Chitinophaga tropicalis]|uniref:Uncharacterized protein n=1 Tax=Chitinophaga tropicalis TaxID=2683588 RepID=A0A7K1U5P1_9BACT|nr:hypothetical protein [Chitinophaga tropicalis]MVT09684.1 hypothetical protein [Chitinophaga tropicalis]